MPARNLVLASLLALGCGVEAPAPDKPTWADDVQPIMKANCFHCHGPSADIVKFDTVRWDVFDLTEMPYADMGFNETAAFTSASNMNHTLLLVGFVGSPDPTKRMPPPPALPLSARDIKVLENWQATMRTKGEHHPNHKPTLKWLKKPTQYQVHDDDEDQVLGKLDCGGMAVSVTRSGVLSLPEGVTPPCTGTIYDGFATAAVSLN